MQCVPNVYINVVTLFVIFDEENPVTWWAFTVGVILNTPETSVMFQEAAVRVEEL